ncbi:hypothetical protein PYW07_009309 [Mythimna separata]|uniref:Peptidase S1 domain-containing protein n=1 Tax=Mythimna separata TaxID=271217 RepID=A0AAD7YCA1_MYTSE|nr:hypothetical protein PYW07_009309 [Mythimna separata]
MLSRVNSSSSNDCYLILVIFKSRNKMAERPCQKMAALLFIVMNSMTYVTAHQEMSSLSDLSDEAPALKTYYSAEAHEDAILRKAMQYEGLPIEYNRRALEEVQENVTNELTTEATTSTTKRLVLDRRYRRIYNPDEVATIEEFPYMAALLVNNELWCGAVIIDKDKVLTAAHCLQLCGAVITDRHHHCGSLLQTISLHQKRLRFPYMQCSWLTISLAAAPSSSSETRSLLPQYYGFKYPHNIARLATIQEFAYMVALLVNNKLWCGAVIMDKDKVLTAAHCLQLQYNNRFFREYVKMLSVRVGSTNATSGGELLRVSEIYFHPNYKPQTLEFNYAVLRIHKNMTFGRKDPAIEKISYAKDRIIPVDNQVMFLGWGSVLGIDGAGGTVLLQKVTLPVYDTSDCQEVYGRDLVTRSNFCAGFITIPKNVCNHDAGGPAIMDGVLVGVLSFSSKRCDQADQPAVFSTVGAIADWLNQVGEKKNKQKSLMQ